jgi:ABC-type phosphate/phosphonate transport system substrate-binding protein
MMKRLFIIPLLAVLMAMATACAPAASEQPAAEQATGPVVTVYHSPT